MCRRISSSSRSNGLTGYASFGLPLFHARAFSRKTFRLLLPFFWNSCCCCTDSALQHMSVVVRYNSLSLFLLLLLTTLRDSVRDKRTLFFFLLVAHLLRAPVESPPWAPLGPPGPPLPATNLWQQLRAEKRMSVEEVFSECHSLHCLRRNK